MHRINTCGQDQDLLCGGVGTFGEFAVLEAGARAEERDQFWRIDGERQRDWAASNQLECHGDSRGTAPRLPLRCRNPDRERYCREQLSRSVDRQGTYLLWSGGTAHQPLLR